MPIAPHEYRKDDLVAIFLNTAPAVVQLSRFVAYASGQCCGSQMLLLSAGKGLQPCCQRQVLPIGQYDIARISGTGTA